MQTILKVVKLDDVKAAKTGNGHYQTIRVQQYRLIPVGNSVLQAVTAVAGTRVLWSERTKKDGSGKVKGDLFYNSLNVGDPISGEIVRFNTTPYEIDGKTVTSFSTVVFEGENALNVANSQLSSHNACVVDENGVQTRDLTSKVTKVTEDTPIP